MKSVSALWTDSPMSLNSWTHGSGPVGRGYCLENRLPSRVWGSNPYASAFTFVRLDRNGASIPAKRVRLLPRVLSRRLMVMAFGLYPKRIWVQVPSGRLCASSPTGRGSGLKPHSVWVRIPGGALRSHWRNGPVVKRWES